MAKNKTCSRTAINSLIVIGKKNMLGHPFLCTKYKQENIQKLKNNEVSNFSFSFRTKQSWSTLRPTRFKQLGTVLHITNISVKLTQASWQLACSLCIPGKATTHAFFSINAPIVHAYASCEASNLYIQGNCCTRTELSKVTDWKNLALKAQIIQVMGRLNCITCNLWRLSQQTLQWTMAQLNNLCRYLCALTCVFNVHSGILPSVFSVTFLLVGMTQLTCSQSYLLH